MRKILYFGIYNADYCRNRNIIKAFRQNDVAVIEVKDTTRGPIKYFKIWKKYRKIDRDFHLVS